MYDDVDNDLPENIVPLLLEDAHSHVEVMVLHSGCGVDSCQGRADVNHELVVEASMIQIMTEGSDEHGQHLQGPERVSA